MPAGSNSNMKYKSYIALALGAVCLVMLLMGLCLMLFPPLTTVSQQKESWSNISIPTPIPAHSKRQAMFSASAGDYMTFCLSPKTGFPPTPISFWGGSITASIYFGSQVLYSNTADDIDGTVNLPQAGTYTFEVVNDNDFEVLFESSGAGNSYLRLHHPYMEYSQVQDTSLQSTSLMLIMGSIAVGVASLLIAVVQQKKAYQVQ